MKNLIRIKGPVWIAGVILLSTVFLLNCSSSEKNKVIIWTSLRPVERDFLQEKLDEFGKTFPGYEFTQLFYSPEELRTNFIISALAGKGPDLIHCASDFIGPLAELEVIRPLEDVFETALLDSFIQEPVAANTYFQDHLYQIADRVGNHLCLVYNKDLVQNPPRSISELIDMKDQLVKDIDGDGDPDTYALAWNYTEPAFAVPFIGGYGGWIVDENKNPTLNTPEVTKAAQLIYDLANKYQIIPRESDYETANALFMDRRVAMIINGPWSWGTYLKNHIDIGLARIPKIDETGLWPTPMVFPMGYCFNHNLSGERLEMVVSLIKYLTSPAVELNFAVQFNIIPSRLETLQNKALEQNVLFQQALDQMMVGRPMPVFTEMRWIWDAMRPAYQGIFTNQVAPEEAARQMQQLAEKLIKENREG
ncbi:MAG: extracellular solute-binding protein [bacterium]|nr:MAG: extracellular solute-binding protein [bacterium]